MAGKIRTLLFSTLYPSSVRPSHGIFVETRLRELLGSGEVEARVVAPVPWFFSTNPMYGEYALMARTPRHEIYQGMDVLHPRYFLPPKVGMTMAPFSMALAAMRLIRQLQRAGYDFDLIDAHYYYPDGVAAALLARWLGKPYVITARGTDLNLIPEHALARQMMLWAARGAEASIGVCAALMDVLKSWGLPPERLLVMRNGVDLQRFLPRPPALARRELGLHGEPILLSVGHLVERKGNHVVIGALARLLPQYPQARLVLVGDGPERNSLQALARSLGVASSVQFVGAVPNHELASWYSAADLLVLASSREGWANVLLESMACGTPVVATRIWGTPEVVSNTRVGSLVEQREPGPFAQAIAALLEARPDRAQVRAYAEDFSWQATSDAQVALFRRIVGNRLSPGRSGL